jgi:hypothetical protein
MSQLSNAIDARSRARSRGISFGSDSSRRPTLRSIAGMEFICYEKVVIDSLTGEEGGKRNQTWRKYSIRPTGPLPGLQTECVT